MTEYRMALPGEEEQLLDFINMVFSQLRVPHDFEALLPKVYAHPGFSRYHAAALEDGRLRATIALLPETLRVTEDHLLKIGYIGSVSTHPKARGQGHMKALMQMLLEQARARQMDFLALGGQRQRYGHYGFEKGCAQAVLTVTRKNMSAALNPAENMRLVPIAAQDAALLKAAHALCARQPMTCLREEARFGEIMRTYKGQLYALLKENAFEGYMYVHENHIAELALCRENDIDAALKAWLAERSETSIAVPLHCRQRLAALQRYAEEVSLQDSQMLLILNWQRVLSACFALACASRPMADGCLTVEIAGEGAWSIRMQGQKCKIATAEGPAEVRFTPAQAVTAFFSAASPLLCDHPLLRDWLPLSLNVPVPDQF